MRCSAHTTTLSDARRDHRRDDVGGATSVPRGPPPIPITRPTFPTCRAHYPNGPERVRLSVASPLHSGLPRISGGSASMTSLQGLLRLHSRYGLPDCSTAQGGLCHEASARPVTQTDRSSATRVYRQLPGWILPPLVNRAVGAH